MLGVVLLGLVLALGLAGLFCFIAGLVWRSGRLALVGGGLVVLGLVLFLASFLVVTSDGELAHAVRLAALADGR